MNEPSRPGRRLRIDRLELDLRGVPRATAEAAARALGPALAHALESCRVRLAPAGRIDAGRIATAPSAGAGELAAAIAERIARAAREEGK